MAQLRDMDEWERMVADYGLLGLSPSFHPLGLLRKRYVEVNDYNRNLVGLLRGRQAAGAVRLLEERPAAFGTNALLPASVLAWAPA